MTPQQWADLSNLAIYAAMLVLVLAMVFFAASFAGRRSASVAQQQSAPLPVGVGGGAGEPPELADQPVVSGSGERGRRAGNIAMALTWLGFGMLVVALVARGVWAGRAPWGNMYEFSLSSAAAALGIFLVLSLSRDVRWFGVFLIPAVLLTLGLAITVLYTEAAQLVPALDSVWLVIHVSAAVVCGGALPATRSVGPARRCRLGGPTAGRAAPRHLGLPDGGLHDAAVDLRDRRGRDLGRGGVGPVLGVGPEGDLGSHHLVGVRRLPPCPGHRRVARPTSCLAGRDRHGDLHLQLFRGQSALQRPALLRRGLAFTGADRVTRSTSCPV